MEYIRVSAKTVADAVIEASIQLGVSSDNMEYEVLEQGSSGFLGFGRKQAVIQARKKQTAEADFEEEIKASIKENMKPGREQKESARPREKQKEKAREPKAAVKEPEKKPEPEKKAEPEKKPEAEKKAEQEKTAREYQERQPRENRGFRQKNEAREAREARENREPRQKNEAREAREAGTYRETMESSQSMEAAASEEFDDNAAFDFSEEEPAKISAPRAPIDKEEAIRRAEDFLSQMLKAMDMEVNIKCSFDEEENLNIDLDGTDMGILIGKRGQTLDAVQYLTSLAVNKGKSSYVRVKVDTEDYRRRRKETLENLARNIASKVRRTQKTVFLEPMNPYERRIIHSALQNNPYVSTHSEGEEPYRKVVVTPKRQNNDRPDRYESGSNRYSNNRYDRRQRNYSRDRRDRAERRDRDGKTEVSQVTENTEE